jgi:hypothetical protein
MPVSKITLSTAMRARDVSRPRAEDLAAADSEDLLAHPRGPAAAEDAEPAGKTESARGRTADGTAATVQPAGEAIPPIPAPPSRRQRRRNR